MPKSVSAKMGIKKYARSIIIDGPHDAVASIDPPDLNFSQTLRGEFDYIHLFAVTQLAVHKRFAKLKDHLKASGMLWVSWPKAKQLDTDLTLATVIRIGYDYGLVESKSLSINETWSALKFTHPKAGKKYANSYGKLKE